MVRLRLPMPVRRIESHPYVAENAGRVALGRGPLLYCVEAVDNPGLDPRDIVLPAAGTADAAFRSDLLGGLVVLTVEAVASPPGVGWANRLYRPTQETPNALSERWVTATAIPYHAWANREAGPMLVWLKAGG